MTEVWQKLRETKKPIILYGMGNGAEKILNYCKTQDIVISEIMASDLFVRGQEFRGYKVKTFIDIKKQYNEFIIVVAFASQEKKVIEYIHQLDKEYELYIPDVPIYGENIFNIDFFYLNKARIEKVYNLLSDEKSKQVYENIIKFKITGQLKYLNNTDSEKEEIFQLLDLKNDEIYLDAGAYTGDTIRELLTYTGDINKIYAFEPDNKNYTKLQNNFNNTENLNIKNKIELFNCGLWSTKQTMCFSSEESRNSSINTSKSTQVLINVDILDNIVHEKVTYIKYDVEGSEYEALDGSIKTICKYMPKLCVSLYHRSEDIFKLPLFVNKICRRYKFFLRKHIYIPSWDVNLYCKITE